MFARDQPSIGIMDQTLVDGPRGGAITLPSREPESETRGNGSAVEDHDAVGFLSWSGIRRYAKWAK
jgi:hypothetical protein